MREASKPTMARRAQAARALLREEPWRDPYTLLAAVVWPVDDRLRDHCLLCDRGILARGLCSHHYWAADYAKRKAA